MTTKDQDKIEELIDKHGFFETGALKSALQEAITFGREQGRRELLEELNHEEKKFIDGFSHPRDCELCKKNHQTP